MECIILAGGLGTRLRGVIGTDLPKCLAPVAGKPFLHWLFRELEAQGCTRVILSLGHNSGPVFDFLMEESPAFRVDHVIENEPLGTGGGIRLAVRQATGDTVFVLNGDTMFRADLAALRTDHEASGAETSLALKAMRDFDRYGTVRTDERGCVLSFLEKAPMTEGKINGGIYCIDRPSFLQRELPEKFSFEKDYLEAAVGEGKFYGFEDAGYFIDIGVPQDYEQAQQDFAVIFGNK